MKISLVSLCAMLVPAVALAQPVPAPTDPDEPYVPVQDVTPPPVQPVPVVILNPTGRATVVSTEPSYETVQDQWNAPVFASGAVMFMASYGAAVIGASAQDDADRADWADRLYVPVAGPWLALNDHGSCPITRPSCDDSTTTKVLLVADGVFQGVGIITMVSGLLQPSYHRRVVRTSATDTKVRVRPTTVGRGGSGLSVFGRF